MVRTRDWSFDCAAEIGLDEGIIGRDVCARSWWNVCVSGPEERRRDGEATLWMGNGNNKIGRGRGSFDKTMGGQV